jgi:hypothetical protein
LAINHHEYFITQVPANEYNATAPSYLLVPENLELLETEHTSHCIGDRAHLTLYWRQSTPHIVFGVQQRVLFCALYEGKSGKSYFTHVGAWKRQ